MNYMLNGEAKIICLIVGLIRKVKHKQVNISQNRNL